MKKVLLCILFPFLAIVVHATGQDGDIIYIDGTRWVLLGRPICVDSLLYHDLRVVLPPERSITTANWDGFIAYWSIKQNVLYLDSIRCEHYDSDTKDYTVNRISSDTLLHVFKKHVMGNLIVGSWLTKDIRVAKGKLIYYQHMGFERNYEEEQIISIDKGIDTGKKV